MPDLRCAHITHRYIEDATTVRPAQTEGASQRRASMLTQLFRLNGAFILSRSGSDDAVPPATLARFEAAVREHGYNPKDFCIWDNSQCTNGSKPPTENKKTEF